MQTFCPECGNQEPTILYAEVRECCVCGSRWECRNNPETTALRAKIERMIADNALHCKQYNAGVDDAKAGKVCGPRPDFDTSTYYDGYSATMLPVLRERIAELEAALAKWKECAKMLADELTEANSARFPVSWEDASETSHAWIIYANLKGGE